MALLELAGLPFPLCVLLYTFRELVKISLEEKLRLIFSF